MTPRTYTPALVLPLLLAACASTPPTPPSSPTPPPPSAPPPPHTPPSGPAQSPQATPPVQDATPSKSTPTEPEWREVFPGVRLSRAQRWVEFDGKVPFNPHDPATPITYLEVIACRPDSREHEAVVVADAMPSQVHAALLLAGAVPGSPAAWRWDDQSLTFIPPKGSRLDVTLAWTDPAGLRREHPAADLVLHAEHKQPLAQRSPGDGFVFAGSGIVGHTSPGRYAADLSGTLVGLHTFGDEPIAWSAYFNPDAGAEDPVWILNADLCPPVGTVITVRLRVID
ncbi:MAG: hypothetical protein HRU70_02215 [Phycisphaeraceae bacterium]|nr:MAG: hypothetical protein HRU70_02215 [Phycisphaeraceae bacterium]